MTLLEIAHDKRLTETAAMNALQEFGVISDRAVWMRDIHPDDLERAKEWLRKYQPESQ